MKPCGSSSQIRTADTSISRHFRAEVQSADDSLPAAFDIYSPVGFEISISSDVSAEMVRTIFDFPRRNFPFSRSFCG